MRDGLIFEIGRVMTTYNDFRLKTLIRLDRSHANKKLISNTLHSKLWWNTTKTKNRLTDSHTYKTCSRAP